MVWFATHFSLLWNAKQDCAMRHIRPVWYLIVISYSVYFLCFWLYICKKVFFSVINFQNRVVWSKTKLLVDIELEVGCVGERMLEWGIGEYHLSFLVFEVANGCSWILMFLPSKKAFLYLLGILEIDRSMNL